MAVRVIVAKPGLDGHDRGAKVVARALRDAGFEVVYTGLHQTPAQIVTAAIQEDAQAIGMSIHSGAHLTLFPKVVDLLRAQDADDIVVFGGGIIPAEDIPTLKEAGVAEIFTPGTPMSTITDWVRDHVGAESGSEDRLRDRTSSVATDDAAPTSPGSGSEDRLRDRTSSVPTADAAPTSSGSGSEDRLRDRTSSVATDDAAPTSSGSDTTV